MSKYIVKISANIINFPQKCVCCGDDANDNVKASASKKTNTKKSQKQTKSWDFPCCSDCVRHIDSYHLYKLFFYLSFIFIFPIFLALKQKEKITNLLKNNCTTDKLPVEYLGWERTIHTFSFTNEDYAVAFVEANKKKIVEVKEIYYNFRPPMKSRVLINERDLLLAAKKNNGKLTPSLLALETNSTIEVSSVCLNKLAEKGVCCLEHTDNNTAEYHFKEFIV